MRAGMHRCKTAMPRARAGGIAENGSNAGGIMYCEKGRPPARAGGMAF